MRRSIRDAIVGFTVLGGIVGFGATALWMRGVRLGASTWMVTARFADAGGLAERSPVTYRGILVGSVKTIRVTPEAVVADLEINQGDLKLAQPVTATVASGSLLGGDALIALVSKGKPLPEEAPRASAADCVGSRQLCNGATIQGQEAPSLSTVTETIQALLSEAQKANLIPALAQSTQQFETTSKDASLFLNNADQAVAEIELLVKQLRAEAAKVEPMIENLNAATGNAVKASAHVNNIVAALDNPKTLNELRQTAANAADLTAKIDAVGGDVEKLTSDEEFMKGLRSVTIGLGELFAELYPAETSR
ncbi:MAG: MlaD family protein [Parasynechococcus sp.]|jgi:phospholipid/cholesterol/gamma-HCH transport system substrate-binding protein|uniref:MlaD family protein n=1 Tax=Parasynechococcus sp. TaxID=3101203 RepID=UPI000B69E5FE|nr:MAG: mammalian cell entry protein [Synechococcus sp. TMED205]HCX53749.1 MCE family protein [Synechococcus sp. UBA9887]|tara:strand:+ start:757 stop:1680 length:924 start_codon:yes stop_codon:yes gene_type:complete